MRTIITVVVLFFVSQAMFSQSTFEFNDVKAVKLLERKLNLEDVTMKANAFNYEDFEGTLNGKLFEIYTEDCRIGILYAGRVNCCRQGGCSLTNKESQSYEYFDYFLVFDPDYTISLVKVFNYQATHGHEICSAKWLKQFIGYNYRNKEDLNGEVDAISGATISVNAITSDIVYVAEVIVSKLAK